MAIQLRKLSPATRAGVILAFAAAGVVSVLVILRLFGLFYPYYIPTGSMTPAVSPGDHVFAEGLTFLVRKPHRGDIITFTSDGIDRLEPDTTYDKRIVGEPSEHLLIENGNLYINGQLTVISNRYGAVNYFGGEWAQQYYTQTNVDIPAGSYFVVGDNATNSLDSRTWGCLPVKNIRVRIFFCYWPPNRLGFVK